MHWTQEPSVLDKLFEPMQGWSKSWPLDSMGSSAVPNQKHRSSAWVDYSALLRHHLSDPWSLSLITGQRSPVTGRRSPVQARHRGASYRQLSAVPLRYHDLFPLSFSSSFLFLGLLPFCYFSVTVTSNGQLRSPSPWLARPGQPPVNPVGLNPTSTVSPLAATASLSSTGDSTTFFLPPPDFLAYCCSPLFAMPIQYLSWWRCRRFGRGSGCGGGGGGDFLGFGIVGERVWGEGRGFLLLLVSREEFG